MCASVWVGAHVTVTLALHETRLDNITTAPDSTGKWFATNFIVVQARDSDSQAVAGGLQSLCWGSSAVGGIASAYFSGALLETMTTREVFSLTTYLPLLITVCAIFIDERRQKVSLGR